MNRRAGRLSGQRYFGRHDWYVEGAEELVHASGLDNVPWNLVVPWLLGGATALSCGNDLVAGVALLLLSLRRGPVNERFDTWDRWVF